MANSVDHFAIGATDLEQGVAALKNALGVEVPRGGKHDAMSTHNCVMKAGDGCFLEILAIDPEAPQPVRKRWFTLDDPVTQARLVERPRALCWVVRTDDLDGIVAKSPVDLGEVVHFSRGDRTWRLTVPQDGSLPKQGLIPAFIEWSPGPHPSAGMKDFRMELEAVRLTHPDPQGLQAILAVLGVDHLAEINEGPCALSFRLTTPDGELIID